MGGREVVGRLNARAVVTSTTMSCPKYVYRFRTAAAFSPRRLHHKWCCKGDCAIWFSGRRDQPVANSVPTTQPVRTARRQDLQPLGGDPFQEGVGRRLLVAPPPGGDAAGSGSGKGQRGTRCHMDLREILFAGRGAERMMSTNRSGRGMSLRPFRHCSLVGQTSFGSMPACGPNAKCRSAPKTSDAGSRPDIRRTSRIRRG